MRKLMLRDMLFAAAAAIGLAMGATPAHAGSVFQLGNNPQPNEENLLLTKGQTGNTVGGFTNQSNIPVDIISTQTLLNSAGGQAQTNALSGPGGSTVPFTNFTIEIPNGTFTDLIFNPRIGGQPPVQNGTADISVLANEPGGGTQTSTFTYSLGNGQNYLTILASGGETMRSVSFTSTTGFNDLIDVRISGSAVVPEPLTIVMALEALVSLGVVMVRRRRRDASP